MSERKPCPFCGSNKSTVKPVWKTYWFVACSDCKAGGPIRKTPEEAEEAWNERCEQTCRCVQETDFAPIFYYEHTLSCGHKTALRERTLNYCPVCGAKVVDE